jgi:hypothetical protein
MKPSTTQPQFAVIHKHNCFEKNLVSYGPRVGSVQAAAINIMLVAKACSMHTRFESPAPHTNTHVRLIHTNTHHISPRKMISGRSKLAAETRDPQLEGLSIFNWTTPNCGIEASHGGVMEISETTTVLDTCQPCRSVVEVNFACLERK